MIIFEDKQGNVKFVQRDGDNKPIRVEEILDQDEKKKDTEVEEESEDE